MFKTALFLNINNQTLNPFACETIKSLIRGGILVISQSMVHLMDQHIAESVVIIGEQLTDIDAKYVKDIPDCIKYLSSNYNHKTWWILCDNKLLNKLIWNGIIMDVHYVKNYAKPNTSEWRYWQQFAVLHDTMFDRNLLKNVNSMDNGFELVSSAKDNCGSQTNLIRHFCRRNHEESTLLNTMGMILTNGFRQHNRTGICTRAVFGKQFQYIMAERVDPNTGVSSFRLPLLTTKKMFVRGIFAELKWFLSGGTNSKELEAQGVNIWKGNSSREFLDSQGLYDYAEGECGPIYGFQWRHWGAEYIAGKNKYDNEGINQIQKCIDSIKTDPFSRRHIINGWNASNLDQMCLPPCHVFYHFMCHEQNGQKYLSLSMTQRSCDTLLGLPFNICSMGLFLMMMCHQVGMKPYKLIHNVNDMHIYESHIPAVEKQLQRDPCMFPYIRIESDVKSDIKDYNYDNVVIEDYYSHNPIKAGMIA